MNVKDMPQKQIFLSYSWRNKDVADEIDEDFRNVGITLARDVRDIQYTGSIKEFMQRIGKNDFVLMLISEDYVRSENCMYEVTELLASHEFEKRILPIVINNTDLFSRKQQGIYFDYWKDRCVEATELFSKHQNEKTLVDKRKLENIYNQIGLFFQKITDIKSETFDVLKKSSYSVLFKRIGHVAEDVLDKVILISKIENIEEREIKLELLASNYRENKFVLFQRARNAESRNQKKLARVFYENLLTVDPSFVIGHNNLGLILMTEYSEFESAKFHFQQAIKLNSEYSEPHCNLANLLQSHFGDYQAAREHYERSIEINPNQVNAIVNLGNILRLEYEEFDLAAEMYEKAIEIEPHNTSALYNYGLLLETNFEDYINAKVVYEKIISIDPTFENAYNALGLLLLEYLNDAEGAKSSFEKALNINPYNHFADANLRAIGKN